MRRIEDTKKGLACHALGRNRLLPCSDCAYHGPGLPPCGKAVHEDAIAMLEQLEAQVPKWISVEERLPENADDVLIVTNCGIGLGYYSIYFGEWVDYVDTDSGRVTHWMPLPEEPKEDDE